MEYQYGYQMGTPVIEAGPGYADRVEPYSNDGDFELRIEPPDAQHQRRPRTTYQGVARGRQRFTKQGRRNSQALLGGLLAMSLLAFGARQMMLNRAATAAAGLKRQSPQQQVAEPAAEKIPKAKVTTTATTASPTAKRGGSEIPWMHFVTSYWPVILSLYSPLLALVVSVVTFAINQVNRGAGFDLDLSAYLPLIHTATGAAKVAWSKIEAEVNSRKEKKDEAEE